MTSRAPGERSHLRRTAVTLAVAMASAFVVACACQGRSLARAEESLPPGEPLLLDEQLQALPPGVTVLPDGTLMEDGIVVGAVALDSAKQRRMRQAREFSSQWVPGMLYLDDWRVFVPHTRQDITASLAGEATVTGLATASGSDELVCALAEPEGSRLVAGSLDEHRLGVRRTIVEADALGGEALWFRDGISVSPNKQWIVTCVFDGRGGATAASGDPSEPAGSEARSPTSDVWLIDGVGPTAPRRLAVSSMIRSCSWSADGARAVLDLATPGQDGTSARSLFLLDAPTAEMKAIPLAPGPSRWEPSGGTILIRPEEAPHGMRFEYDVASGRSVETHDPLGPVAGRALWSPNGDRWAAVDVGPAGSVPTIGDPSGRTRRPSRVAGVRRLLGWSAGSELVAYVGANDALCFSVGAVSESGYRRINAAIPPAWRERDEERPGLHKSAADAMGLDTTVSPIPIASDRLVAHAWGMTSEGPCFVYAERGDGQPRVYAVRFLRIGLEDMGIDPRRSLEEQIVRDALDNAAAVFAHALSSYAEEHEGRLPTHVGGPGLEAALQPYLHDPHALRALYEPDKVSARLLKPGALLSELGGPPGHKQPEPVAEIQEGDVTFLVVAERSPAFGPHEEESGRPSIVVSLRAMCSEDSG